MLQVVALPTVLRIFYSSDSRLQFYFSFLFYFFFFFEGETFLRFEEDSFNFCKIIFTRRLFHDLWFYYFVTCTIYCFVQWTRGLKFMLEGSYNDWQSDILSCCKNIVQFRLRITILFFFEDETSLPFKEDSICII